MGLRYEPVVVDLESGARPRTKPPRLVSLDVFRGLTVAVMIVVDDAGGAVPAINHSPWNGLTIADYVMPFFLFIVGLSLSLAYKKVPHRGVATKNALLRAFKLLLLGLLLQGGFFHGLNHLSYGVDLHRMRWMGILQRVAIAYLVAALCEIWLRGGRVKVDSISSLLRKYQLQWCVSGMLCAVYLVLLYALYVPDWEFQIPSETPLLSPPTTFLVKCGVRGETGPACNAAGMIDRRILGIEHLYASTPVYARTQQCSTNSPDYGPLPADAPSWCGAPFEPEGILSSLMAVVTCLVGLHYGHVIVHLEEHRDRITHWFIPSASLLVLGFALECVGMHVNKALYTLSYMCVTAGAAGALFLIIFFVVDVRGYRRSGAQVFEWMGKHALLIFALAACNLLPLLLQGFYWNRPRNNILRLIGIGTGSQ